MRLLALAVVVVGSSAHAATYQVGPGHEHTELDKALARSLEPGDVVEVDGDHTYAPIVLDGNDGTAEAPIVIRGLRQHGKRPRVAGGEYGIMLLASNYRLEGFEVTGKSSICLFHRGDHTVIRDSVVHDCSEGLLSSDSEAGTLIIEFSEFYRNGSGEQRHQLYVETDPTLYPDSYFRLAHCYIHDGTGGNNVKTRAARNEIHYNWIQGARFHELDLVEGDGPHPTGYSDVVGNVLIKAADAEWFIARFGGDGENGGTDGRYRFVNNTMICGPARTCLRAQESLDSVVLWNNVVYFPAAASDARLFSDGDASWTSGARVLAGGGNWISSGVELPEELVGSMTGSEPGFVDFAGLDLRPAPGSPLVDGAITPADPPEHLLVGALMVPVDLPPWGIFEAPDTDLPRQAALLDVGAFEADSPAPLTRPGQLEPGEGGGGCAVGGHGGAGGWAGLLLALGWLVRRRR